MKPSRSELDEMMCHLERYSGKGIGAEQDFLTDFWKTKGGINGLPRKFNCQVLQIALHGPDAKEDSFYWKMVSNYDQEVANWHFSADPKPVDMVWGSIAFPALEATSNSSGPVPADTSVLEAATTSTRPPTTSQSRVVLTPRRVVKGKGKGRTGKGGNDLNIVERGPVRGEYVAPWRMKFTLTALQVEMARRSAPWRERDPEDARNQKIAEVLAKATSMWIQSLHETVWPNIVFMISEEVRWRSSSGPEQSCLMCHQKYELAGRNMDHNLFHCIITHHATEQIDRAAWEAMVKHPFRLQAGAERIDQQLRYLGTLTQVWEDAGGLGRIKPWRNDEICLAPNKNNWEHGERIHTLQKEYHNQRKYSKRLRFDWKLHNDPEERVFRDS